MNDLRFIFSQHQSADEVHKNLTDNGLILNLDNL